MDAPISHRLVVLRHAKSDWPQAPDHDRPLSARGRRDAPAVGVALRELGIVPDLVICSSARRTRQTWRRVAAALGGEYPVRAEPRAYAAPPGELLALLRELPEDVGTAVLVGHNPGVEELVNALAREELTFRTSTFAVVAVEGKWAELAPGTGRLLAFAVARG